MPSFVLITLLIFLLFNVATSDLQLYQEMKNLNASCFPTDSCRNLRHLKNDHLWSNRKCECGYHCVRFGTCCADSVHVAQKFPLPIPEQERCQKFENFPKSVMMVSQCDNGSKWSSTTIEKCEKSDHSSNDRLLYNIPLTNVKTYTTYKNFFCALCNYGGKDFLFWNVDLKTKFRFKLIKNLMKYGKRHVFKNFRYDITEKNWMFLDSSSGKRFEIKFQYIVPPYLRKMAKPCYANLVQSCKSSHVKSSTEHKCHAYYSPIEITTEKGTFLYKNIHCARCNDLEESIEIKSCMKKTSKRDKEYRTSFGILVDINAINGNKVGMTKVPEPDCGTNGIYDPFAKKCRKIVCLLGSGRVLVNGKCVKKETSKRNEEHRDRRTNYITISVSTSPKYPPMKVPKPDCGADRMYDLLVKKCRKLVCPPGMEKILVKCAKKTPKRNEEYRYRNYRFGIPVSINPEDPPMKVPKPDCGADRFYDPLVKQCRKLVCLPGFERFLVKCAKKKISKRNEEYRYRNYRFGIPVGINLE